MNYKRKKTLYLFIDESGNFDFKKSGTAHFVLTCVSTFNPTKERFKFSKLRYQLLTKHINQEFFHATEDKQSVRDKVFNLISKIKDDISVNYVVVKKSKIKPNIYIPDLFYREVSYTLLHKIFKNLRPEDIKNVIVVMGAIFTKDKQSSILKILKTYLKLHFSIPFEIYFHKSQSDINSQLADYFGWAIYIKSERNEGRPFNIVKSKIKTTNSSILSEEPEGSY